MLIDRVAIVGAGYTGLAAATYFCDRGISVDVYETGSKAGGLAKGIDFNGHDWPLDLFYHHWFYKEKALGKFANLHGLRDQIQVYSPTTSFYLNGEVRPFDQPHHILSYPGLSTFDRYRLGKSLVKLRVKENWDKLEKFTAEQWLIDNMGKHVYEKMWKPMLVGKWGAYYNQINMAWFWARIHVRTKKLMYPKGGFQSFTDKIVKSLEEKGVSFHFNHPITNVKKKGNEVVGIDKEKAFNKVILTVGPKIFAKIVNYTSKDSICNLNDIHSTGAICATFILNKSILQDTYWLNVPAKSTDFLSNEIPFLAFVEHTNMIPSKHYGGHHIIYCANYLSPDSEFFNFNNDKILDIYTSGLKKLSPDLTKNNILAAYVSRTEYAQPVFLVNHSNFVPSFETSIPNVYWASMSHVYPWDRGTNYAVDLGFNIANYICSK